MSKIENQPFIIYDDFPKITEDAWKKLKELVFGKNKMLSWDEKQKVFKMGRKLQTSFTLEEAKRFMEKLEKMYKPTKKEIKCAICGKFFLNGEFWEHVEKNHSGTGFINLWEDK